MSQLDDKLKDETGRTPERYNAEMKAKSEAKRRADEYRKQLEADRTTLLKNPAYQRVLADIVARGGLMRSVMTGNSNTFHKSGRQDFAVEIFDDHMAVDQDRTLDLLRPKNRKT